MTDLASRRADLRVGHTSLDGLQAFAVNHARTYATATNRVHITVGPTDRHALCHPRHYCVLRPELPGFEWDATKYTLCRHCERKHFDRVAQGWTS